MTQHISPTGYKTLSQLGFCAPPCTYFCGPVGNSHAMTLHAHNSHVPMHWKPILDG